MSARPGGLFFQPRELSRLSLTELHEYAKQCRDKIHAASSEATYIAGQLHVLRKGLGSDAFWTFGGFITAVVGLGSVTFTGWGGVIVTAVGSGGSLASVKGFLDKTRERSMLKQRTRDLTASIDFCSSEQARIAAELGRRP